MKRRFFVFVLAIFVLALPELTAAQGRGGANKPVKPSRPVTQMKGQKAARPTSTPTTKAKTTRPAKKTSTTTTGTTPTTGTPTTTGETTPPPALPKNARLVEKLQNLLPKGTDMNEAATDFRNQGQFVAAVHVSNNLKIKFEDLKSHMIDDGLTLGQAVHKLRPGVDAEQATAAATAQANTDLGTTQVKNKKRSPR
jgi:hypothetical protein